MPLASAHSPLLKGISGVQSCVPVSARSLDGDSASDAPNHRPVVLAHVHHAHSPTAVTSACHGGVLEAETFRPRGFVRSAGNCVWITQPPPISLDWLQFMFFPFAPIRKEQRLVLVTPLVFFLAILPQSNRLQPRRSSRSRKMSSQRQTNMRVR